MLSPSNDKGKPEGQTKSCSCIASSTSKQEKSVVSGKSCGARIGILAALVILLTGFGTHYFFIKRGVGPRHDTDRVSSEFTGDLLGNPFYRDLREEYLILNKKYAGKQVNVFVGDSITERFNLTEFFPNSDTLNRGIFSDTTLGLLERLDENVNNLTIDTLFIMIGYNDLKYRDNEEIIRNISKILSRIRARTTYLQSLLPVSFGRTETNRRIEELNWELRRLASETGCTYLDLHSEFLGENGGIDPALTVDGVHPNLEGYRVWSEVVAPLLTRPS